jgi:hypothetical protein
MPMPVEQLLMLFEQLGKARVPHETVVHIEIFV